MGRVLMGALVVSGRGLARVDKTGGRAELGKIGASLSLVESRGTRLQQEMRGVVRLFFMASVFISVLVVLLFYWRTNNFIESLLTGLSSSMAILPEEFPVVLSVFLALGSWRLTKNNVLTRSAAVIESLGSATILCTDKTGTLTQNRMPVAALYNGKELIHRPDFIKKLSSFNEPILSARGASAVAPTDPMELAIGSIQQEWGIESPGFVDLIKEYPLSENLLAMSQVWKDTNGGEHLIVAKGAPEAIFSLCRFSQKQLGEVLEVVKKLASGGFRVLGVARALSIDRALPEIQNQFSYAFLGLVAFEDPIRPEVPGAVRECVAAGIKIMVITGDHPETAMSIAKQIELPNSTGVITGDAWEQMNSTERAFALKKCSVFARVRPQQKLSIVEGLQNSGEVVAMTGDGVNDAPALKKADIGMAMGLRGTDVAREAASLVLLDDSFTSIVAGIRSGRKFYDNLQKAMSYIVAIHVPVIGLVLIPALSGIMPLLLLPVHIVCMELVIDPMCSIAFESAAEEKDIMCRPPRPNDSRFFIWKNFWLSLLGGFGVLFFVVLVFLFSVRDNHTIGESRAIAFSSLFFGNLLLIFSSLSQTSSFLFVFKRKNPAALIISGLAILFLFAIVSVHPLRVLFRFENPGWIHFIPVLLGGVGVFLFFEMLKQIKKRS